MRDKRIKWLECMWLRLMDGYNESKIMGDVEGEKYYVVRLNRVEDMLRRIRR